MPAFVEGVERRIPDGGIEKTAKAWGEEKLRRTLGRERVPKRGSVVKVVDKETLSGPLKLPKLALQDRQVASVRFNPLSGEIFIPIWQEMEVNQGEDGSRFLEGADNFVQLRTGRERKVNLKNLPERPLRRLLMARCQNLETAIRQAFHIRERYIEKEAEQLDKIWRQINKTWLEVLERKVTPESLGELATQTALVLEETSLTSARKTAKKNIEKRLIGVFERDRLGRVNPLIQRIKLRSAYLEAVGLEAFSVLVREKFGSIAGVLLMEREITRQALTDTIGALDTIMGFTKRGAIVFEGGRPQRGEKEGLEISLKGIVRLLSIPRVAPYLQTARVAGIALWGCRPECVEVNKAILGADLAKVILDPEFVCVKRLICEGKFQEAKELTGTWVYQPITTLLAEGVIGIEFQ